MRNHFLRAVLANADATLVRTPVAGYFSKGYQNADMFKLDFSSGTWAATTSSPNTGGFGDGLSDPGVAGYLCRGFDGFQTTDIFKWVFPTDSVTTIVGGGGSTHFCNAGFSDPGVAGFFSVGFTSTSPSSSISTVFMYSFPTDSETMYFSTPDGMGSHGGFSNPGTAGYFSRGLDTSTVYKTSFPSSSWSTTTSTPNGMGWTSLQGNHAGTEYSNLFGYFSRGGDFATGITDVYKWAFATDSVTTLTGTSDYGANFTAFSDQETAAYFSIADTSEISQLFFASDTFSVGAAPEFLYRNGGFSDA